MAEAPPPSEPAVQGAGTVNPDAPQGDAAGAHGTMAGALRRACTRVARGPRPVPAQLRNAGVLWE
jgi:hypothetical protein